METIGVTKREAIYIAEEIVRKSPDSPLISVQFLHIVSFRLILVAAVAVACRGPGPYDDTVYQENVLCSIAWFAFYTEEQCY